MVQQANWTEFTGLVTATEIALGRSLAQALSTKKVDLPPLPTWDDLGRSKKKVPEGKSDFVQRFEAVNLQDRRSQQIDVDDDAG